jgi:hypothetical protein
MLDSLEQYSQTAVVWQGRLTVQRAVQSYMQQLCQGSKRDALATAGPPKRT